MIGVEPGGHLNKEQGARTFPRPPIVRLAVRSVTFCLQGTGLRRPTGCALLTDH